MKKDNIILPEGVYFIENEEDEKKILFSLAQRGNVYDPYYTTKYEGSDRYPHIIITNLSGNDKLLIDIKRIYFKG